jgi:transposase-like protein
MQSEVAMRSAHFQKWRKQAVQLTPKQREELQQQLQGMRANHEVERLMETSVPQACPDCHARALGAWGSSHGLRRYRCKTCGKTFNCLSGTALARLRMRDRWLGYAQELIAGSTVRAAAKRCGVDKNTSFLWRHRFLTHMAEHRASHESGIVEADETFFLESFKGQRHLPRPARKRGGKAQTPGLGPEQIPVLVVRDRGGRTADFKLAALDRQSIEQALKPLIDPDAILCTDGAAIYRTFCAQSTIEHHPINLKQGQRVDGAFHIQNVNAYHSRLKSWMRRFHGVATKYLQNYLGWRRMLERYKSDISTSFCLREAIGRPVLQQLIQT